MDVKDHIAYVFHSSPEKICGRMSNERTSIKRVKGDYGRYDCTRNDRR